MLILEWFIAHTLYATLPFIIINDYIMKLQLYAFFMCYWIDYARNCVWFFVWSCWVVYVSSDNFALSCFCSPEHIVLMMSCCYSCYTVMSVVHPLTFILKWHLPLLNRLAKFDKTCFWQKCVSKFTNNLMPCRTVVAMATKRKKNT